MTAIRCPWARDPLEIDYHDREWGRPEHDDRKLWEMLVLEGMQAGLSWLTVLRKREHMRTVLDGFDPEKMAAYDEAKQAELLADPGVIRNRAKIRALATNARAFLRIQEEFGSFDRYLWAFVDGRPVINTWREMTEAPSETPLSQALSRDLKKRGFTFVGSTICYAYLQAVGLVNDHAPGCSFRDRRVF